jgi:hypothetical protein
MKNVVLKGLALFGLVIVLSMSSVQAQTSGKTKVRIPFDFVAGKSKLKAGTYSVRQLSDNALVIRSEDNGTSAILSAPLSIGTRANEAGRRLVFNKYGDWYFLSQVWLRADSGRQLFPTSAETRAAREFRLATGRPTADRVAILIAPER